MRTLALPNATKPWSLTSPCEKLIKIVAKVAEEDPTIAVAMAAAAGTVANATVADRLAALQQRK